MPRGVTMVLDGVKGSELFPEPFPKSPCRLPHVFLIAIYLVTLVPVDYPTFLIDIIQFFGSHQEVLNSVAFLKVDLELLHEQVCCNGTDGGIHGYAMNLFIILILEEEIGFFRQYSSNAVMCCMDMEALL